MNGKSIEHAATVSSATISGDSAAHAEVVAYAAAAGRGDVLPACMRLSTARAEGEWALRSQIVRQAGPASPQAALDLACSFMPNATEPRLLRAARSIAIAASMACSCARDAWLAFAHADLLSAVRLDAMDPTARGMLAELVGAAAWAPAQCAA